MKFNYLLLGSLMLGSLASAAGAQTLSPGDSKLLHQIAASLGGSYTSVSVLDTTTDAAGFRYITGRADTASDTDAFVAKMASRPGGAGGVAWISVISGATKDVGRAIALDSSGNVYMVTNPTTVSTPKLRKYTNSGTLLYTETFGFNGTDNDLVILPSGLPVSVGTYNGTQLMAHIWDPTGASTGGMYLYYAKTGAMTAATLDASGNLYLTGRGSFDGTAANEVCLGYLSGSVPYTAASSVPSGTASLTYYSVGGNMFDIKMDPLSGLAVACGYYLNGTPHTPIVLMGKYNTTSGFVDAGAWSASYGTSGGDAQALDIAPDGRVTFAVNGGTSSGQKYVDVYSGFVNATDLSLIEMDLDWADEVPAIDVLTNLVAYDLVYREGQFTLAALDERPVGSPSYKAYNLFTWAADGTRVDRRVLPASDTPIPSSYSSATFPKDNLTFAGGVLNMYAGTSSNKTGIWTAGSVPGPDDLYKTTKNVAVVVTKATKGNLMENDPNGFVEGLTTSLTPSSSVNLASVTVNPDGTFSATPVTGFAGQAGFQYDVYDGATLVATHSVTIVVKNDHVPPVAVDDTNDSVPVNTVGAGYTPVTIDVLANDSDPNSSALTVFSKTAASHGTVAIVGNQITYKPSKNYVGTDQFTYKIKNAAGDTATATVYITVVQPS